MRVSDKGLDLIRAEEGFREHAYPDPASPLARATPSRRWGFEPANEIRAALPVSLQMQSGFPWTIGYGFTRHLDGRKVLPGDTMTRAEADAQLARQVESYEAGVREVLQVPVNQPMFDALVSICWNIGVGAFQGSTLVRLLNEGRYLEAAREFDRWNRAGGQVMPGLVARRDREQALFEEGLRQVLVDAGDIGALARFDRMAGERPAA
jgi:lysozyme